MVIDRADLPLFAVEIKVSVGAKFRSAETKLRFNHINPRTLADGRAQSVEIGSFRRPEFRRRNGKRIALRPDARSGDFMFYNRVISSGNERFYLDPPALRVGRYRHSGSSVHGRVDAHRIGFDKTHFPVESPENRIVGGVRQIVEIIVVVDDDIEHIGTVRTHPFCKLKTKSRN